MEKNARRIIRMWGSLIKRAHNVKAKSAALTIRVREGKKAKTAMPSVYDAHTAHSILPDKTDLFDFKAATPL